MKRTVLFLFFMVSICVFSQKIPTIEFAVEKGKFIFDQSDFFKFKKQVEEVKKDLKKHDSLKKLYPKNNYTYIDDRMMLYPRLKYSDSIHWTKRLISKIKISKQTKKGENIFCLVINKNGIATKFYADKIIDKKIFKQVQKILLSEPFNKWSTANFYGIEVEYIFKFKFIVDDDFSKYYLKNKWARETDSNLADFGEI